jgi:WD40 repeat protein
MLHTPDCFSADGQRLVLASDDFSARLWDAASGTPLGEPMAHRAAVGAARFDTEGRRVLTASADGGLRLWDGLSGKPLAEVARLAKPLVDARFSPDGKRLLSAGADGSARLWDAQSGAVLGREMTHGAALRLALFSSDGALVLTAADDRSARLWNASSGEPLFAAFEHPVAVRRAGFAAGDSIAWTEAEDGVRLWAVRTGKLLGDSIRHEGLLAADMSPAGKLVATAGKDMTARLWERGAPAPMHTLEHRAPVLALRFNADGRLLATGCEDGSVQVWAADTGRPLVEPLRHDQAALAVGFDATGARLLTLAADRSARLWETKTGKLIGQPMRLGRAAPDTAVTLDRVLNSATLTRLGGERIVTVGGVTGIFTPVTSAGDQPLGEDERKNLLAIIDKLKREVGEVQGRNLQLAADLATLRERPAAPDDFASGVQQSLDELQLRMAAMRNATSNFAVREFKLEASVFVQVSPTGSIEYRFVQPGDKIDAAALSKLSLQIVPLPKDNLAGVWTPNLFQPERPVGDLPEVNDTLARQLEAAGLFSVGEFLQVGTRARAQVYLAALLGVERQRLALWAQQALLMTLRGMSGASALLLIDAQAGSFAALAGLPPAALVALYDNARARRPDLAAPAIDDTLATLWVRGARQYLGHPEPEAPDEGPPPPA